MVCPTKVWIDGCGVCISDVAVVADFPIDFHGKHVHMAVFWCAQVSGTVATMFFLVVGPRLGISQCVNMFFSTQFRIDGCDVCIYEFAVVADAGGHASVKCMVLFRVVN